MDDRDLDTEAGGTRRRERGSSFVEVLVAVVLLGTIVVAALAGLRASITGSSVDEDSARAIAWLQAAGDEIHATDYEPCHLEVTPGDIRASYQTTVDAATRPTDWGAATITVVSVEFLSRSGATESWGSTCASGDPDSPLYAQLVRLRVTDPDGKFTADLEVIKSA